MDFALIDTSNLMDCAELFNSSPWSESWQQDAVVQRLEDCLNAPHFYGLTVSMEDRIVGFVLGHSKKSRQFYVKEMC